jgi:capsular exopolysaccharide synthesis family protein
MLPLADGAARELMPTLVQDDPGSRRQYHLLATRLEAISRSSPLRTIAVTSSIPQEGKTITSLNLAFTLAQEPETRVLLMDSDLRQPALHAYLGHRAIAGVSEILQGKMKLDDALHRIQYENLYVLFAGKKPAEPGGLIASAQMASLLEEIRGKFHYAVIDCPPVGPVADTCTLAGMVDGVVLVVRARFTHREVVTQALEDLNHARLLGIVFNNQQVKATKSRYHYGYGYAEPSKSA